MKKITVINASDGFKYTQRKVRTAAYCRVSTDSDEQRSSLENQATHYTDYIKANSNWEFVGLYYDEGISGTKKEKRTGLLTLVRDCENRKIDFIITKSISRFARNTTDCLEIVRRLTDIGITILFENENINTGTMDSELILSILSSLAAEESISISRNNKWSIKRRFQNGTFRLTSPPYGYNYKEETIIPSPEETLIVKRIFAEVLAGKGTDAVAAGLNTNRIAPKKGMRWTGASVRGILKNEKYIGDALFQKTYTDDNFIRHANDGVEDQYYWRESHEPIISREDFEAVARILEWRGKEKGISKGTGKYNSRYLFSGMITCGECGDTFKRRIHMANKPGEYAAWCCKKHIATNGKSCSMIFVRDEHIQAAFMTMMNRLYSGGNVILKPLIESLKIQDHGGKHAELLKIEKRIQENAEQVQTLTGLMSKRYLEPALFNERNNELQAEAVRLKEQRNVLQMGVDGEEAMLFKVEELFKYLNKNGGITEDFDENIFVRFVSGITVFSPAEIGFNLKCGLCLREGMAR